MNFIVSAVLGLLLCSSVGDAAQRYCWGNNMGSGPYSKACLLPFDVHNETYWECIPGGVDTGRGSNVTWCPTEVADNGTAVDWGACRCDANCDGISRKGDHGSLTVGWPTGYSPNMNCTWVVTLSEEVGKDRVKSLKNPSVVFFFTEIDLEKLVDGVTVYTKQDENSTYSLVYSTIQEYATPNQVKHFGLWSDTIDLQINFFSDSGGEERGFVSYYYLGFCSDFDGEMSLPPRDLHFKPEPIYLISDNFNPKTGPTTPYRPSSTCIWTIPIDPTTHLHTLYFYRFDLRAGDFISVTTGDSTHSFDPHLPPFPISSNSSFKLVFKSDNKDEGLGFEADVKRDGCSMRPVPIQAPIATITDGTPKGVPYQKSDYVCNWLIRPFPSYQAGSYVLFDIAYLNIGKLDVLTFYQGKNNDAPKIRSYQDTQAEMIKFISNSSTILVTFATDDDSTIKPPPGDDPFYGFSFTYKVCTGKCLDCKPGTYYNNTKNECKSCPPPTITTEKARLECSVCPNGTQWKTSAECQPCPPGSFSFGGRDCIPCAPGTVAPREGASMCSPCQATDRNEYAANATSCDQCPQGYKPAPDGSSCNSLPVPLKPKNNEIVLIYLFVGIGVVVIGIVVFAVVQKKSEDNEYTSVMSNW